MTKVTALGSGYPIPVVAGGTGDNSYTPYAVIVAGTCGTCELVSLSTLGTAGQVLTSNGSAAEPSWQAGGSSSFTWTVETGAAVTMASNNGYVANNSGTCVLTLPAVSSVGDELIISGMNNATGWQIAQGAGQEIFIGSANTTSGASGSLTSSKTRDSVSLVCIVANTTWNAYSIIGNITVV